MSCREANFMKKLEKAERIMVDELRRGTKGNVSQECLQGSVMFWSLLYSNCIICSQTMTGNSLLQEQNTENDRNV